MRSSSIVIAVIGCFFALLFPYVLGSASAESFSRGIDRISRQIREAPTKPVEASVPADSTASALVVAKPAFGASYLTVLPMSEERKIADEIKALPSVQGASEPPVILPGVLRQQSTDGQELQLKAIVLNGGSLVRNARGLFAGSIRVGVVNLAESGTGRQLTDPVNFQIAEQDIATPSEISVDRTGPPYRTMKIEVPNAPDGVELHVVSTFEPNGQPIKLELAPEITTSAQKSSIDAYGLEEVKIDVSSSGKNLAGKPVTFAVKPSGYFTSMDSRFGEDGTASATLRSGSPGLVKVVVLTSGLQASQVEVNVNPPVVTVAASLIGSLLGALIRILSGSGRTATRTALTFLASILVGILIFAMYVVGIRVLPFTPAVPVGATLVFVVSALGAYYGTALLPRLSK